jgi:hypothetical protein
MWGVGISGINFVLEQDKISYHNVIVCNCEMVSPEVGGARRWPQASGNTEAIAGTREQRSTSLSVQVKERMTCHHSGLTIQRHARLLVYSHALSFAF